MSVRMITTLASLWWRQRPTLILLIWITLLGGCASLGVAQSTPPVTVSEVIQMSKQGVPAETILDKMRESQTVYRLTAAQLAQLRDQGVANQVIDYMQQTYLSAVRYDQSLEDWDYWSLGADGFWYGGPYYGWPPHWWLRDSYAYGEWRDGGGWGDEDEGHEGERHGAHGRHEGEGHGEHGGHEGEGHGEHGGHEGGGHSGGGHGGGGVGGGGHGGR
jgi:uncharacterized membrane protein YgcG